ncbi:hypothetical protein KY305_02585 [Bacillus sp. YC2]|uniref:hypothetical protein n=1 Tax=Bacillus sp. YC2 TaxID=2861287 RepID=UPI001CA63704|nr:hypothetical protein [Bacillus sp. YC2]MBY8911647.1 hypothetical protein [Bacillus sp. YC2]
MEYMNDKMKKIKDTVINDLSYAKKTELSSLEKVISPNIVKIDDCFILDLENELSNTQSINWDRILKMYGDKTGYEASCNELRVNDCLDNENLSEDEVLIYAFHVMDGWEHQLNESFPEHKFILILTVDEGYATLRFYKFREEESSWLNEDIEKNGEAVLVREINH